jgi:hypothetical protein
MTGAKAFPSGGEARLTGEDAAAVWAQIVSIELDASDLFLDCGMTAIGPWRLARGSSRRRPRRCSRRALSPLPAVPAAWA